MPFLLNIRMLWFIVYCDLSSLGSRVLGLIVRMVHAIFLSMSNAKFEHSNQPYAGRESWPWMVILNLGSTNKRSLKDFTWTKWFFQHYFDEIQLNFLEIQVIAVKFQNFRCSRGFWILSVGFLRVLKPFPPLKKFKHSHFHIQKKKSQDQSQQIFLETISPGEGHRLWKSSVHNRPTFNSAIQLVLYRKLNISLKAIRTLMSRSFT